MFIQDTLIQPEQSGERKQRGIRILLHSHIGRNVVLLVCTALLLCGSLLISGNRPAAYAANPGNGNGCNWYKVRKGDTLGNIASGHRTTIWTLAQVNGIRNVNLIIVGQELCIPYHLSGGRGNYVGGESSGLLSGGSVRWYDYGALEWSNRNQVVTMLHAASARYGLPVNLLLAIAWQESGWNQHVIARDGGIGVMQLMPYTAMSINVGTGIRRDPYHLWDNINLGATYLRWLWNDFHGNIYDVISGYNEGGWNVQHRGIFNWRYVNSVLYLMRAY
jgi:Transglycosylase SLT domain/LysM domain